MQPIAHHELENTTGGYQVLPPCYRPGFAPAYYVPVRPHIAPAGWGWSSGAWWAAHPQPARRAWWW